MDSNDHVIYLTPKEAVELFSKVRDRSLKATGQVKTFLLSSVARIDTALGKTRMDGQVALHGRIGWLRMMGQMAGAEITARIERQLHQEVGE